MARGEFWLKPEPISESEKASITDASAEAYADQVICSLMGKANCSESDAISLMRQIDVRDYYFDMSPQELADCLLL